MSLVRNSIPIQNKSMGDQISFMEWNRVVNQLSTQANILTNVAENIIGEYFDFIWLPNKERPIPNGIDIVVITADLGDLVTDEKTLANYFNKEDSQYPPAEWKYRIIKYKRGTKVLEILSTGVMRFSEVEIEHLINSRFDQINTFLNNRLESVEDNLAFVVDDISHLDGRVGTIEIDKQDKLTPGENITIDEDNVISVSGQVPLEEHDVIINLQQNKADLINGKVPLEQLPEVEEQKGLVISNTEPTDSKIEMWVKLIGEEIIL